MRAIGALNHRCHLVRGAYARAIASRLSQVRLALRIIQHAVFVIHFTARHC